MKRRSLFNITATVAAASGTAAMTNYGEVVMPFSPQNQSKDRSGVSERKWNVLIRKFGRSNSFEPAVAAFLSSSKFQKMADLIKETNLRHAHKWNLKGLENFKPSGNALIDPTTFSHIQDVLESSEQLFQNGVPKMMPPPTFYNSGPFVEVSTDLNNKQAEAILVMALFCMFPFRNSGGPMPSINFSELFSAMDRFSHRSDAANAKMSCIWQYFSTCAYETRNGPQDRWLRFTRRSLNMAMAPRWDLEHGKLSKLWFSDSPIEDQPGPVLEVDFANKKVGGGVLGNGSVQEEIRMALSPEAIVARLFTPPLEDNEVLLITGTKRFSQTTGYSDSFQFQGPYKGNEAIRDIVAMDAMEQERENPNKQYEKRAIDRELNKAYCAFAPDSPSKSPSKIATGHWGCGAFGGDKELKAIIQLLAASKAQREIVFCMTEDSFKNNFKDIYEVLRDVPISSIYKAITDPSTSGPGVFDRLRRVFAGGGQHCRDHAMDESPQTNPDSHQVAAKGLLSDPVAKCHLSDGKQMFGHLVEVAASQEKVLTELAGKHEGKPYIFFAM